MHSQHSQAIRKAGILLSDPQGSNKIGSRSACRVDDPVSSRPVAWRRSAVLLGETPTYNASSGPLSSCTICSRSSSASSFTGRTQTELTEGAHGRAKPRHGAGAHLPRGGLPPPRASATARRAASSARARHRARSTPPAGTSPLRRSASPCGPATPLPHEAKGPRRATSNPRQPIC
jgi:hypothetical protein